MTGSGCWVTGFLGFSGTQQPRNPATIPALLVLLLAAPLIADDDFTLYDLLPPETHQFANTSDVTQTREGRRSPLIARHVHIGHLIGGTLFNVSCPL